MKHDCGVAKVKVLFLCAQMRKHKAADNTWIGLGLPSMYLA